MSGRSRISWLAVALLASSSTPSSAAAEGEGEASSNRRPGRRLRESSSGIKEVRLRPSLDATVVESSPGTNHGNDEELQFVSPSVGGGKGGDRVESVLKFELPGHMTSPGYIESARLWLYANEGCRIDDNARLPRHLGSLDVVTLAPSVDLEEAKVTWADAPGPLTFLGQLQEEGLRVEPVYSKSKPLGELRGSNWIEVDVFGPVLASVGASRSEITLRIGSTIGDESVLSALSKCSFASKEKRAPGQNGDVGDGYFAPALALKYRPSENGPTRGGDERTTAPCAPKYVANAAYEPGDVISNGGRNYECGAASWCGETGYRPGDLGAGHWPMAWTVLGECDVGLGGSSSNNGEMKALRNGEVRNVAMLGKESVGRPAAEDPRRQDFF